MKKRPAWKIKFKAMMDRIHLVDKCLILFMILLMVQSSYSLFFNSMIYDAEVNGIDVVIRTSAAAIFGYFLSANFIRGAQAKANKEVQNKEADKKAIIIDDIKSIDSQSAIINQIGFQAEDNSQSNEIAIGNIATAENKDLIEPDGTDDYDGNRMQIILATVMGLFCFLILIILRNISAAHPDLKVSQDTLATVTQFRDFISGCVGFLIGTPTSSRNG